MCGHFSFMLYNWIKLDGMGMPFSFTKHDNMLFDS